MVRQPRKDQPARQAPLEKKTVSLTGQAHSQSKIVEGLHCQNQQTVHSLPAYGQSLLGSPHASQSEAIITTSSRLTTQSLFKSPLCRSPQDKRYGASTSSMAIGKGYNLHLFHFDIFLPKHRSVKKPTAIKAN